MGDCGICAHHVKPLYWHNILLNFNLSESCILGRTASLVGASSVSPCGSARGYSQLALLAVSLD